jgi:hypothetical protein
MNNKNSEERSIWKIADSKDDQNYKNEVHPNNQKFWKDLPKHSEEPLGKHPVFTLEGEQLDKASYQHTRNIANKNKTSPMQMMSLFQEMVSKEHTHKAKLEKLAVQAVAKLMHVDPSELKAKLSHDVEPNETAPLTKEEASELSPELLDEANKRITSNAFAQGASVHAYLTAHFLDEIESQIKKIDPKLIDIYSKISSGSHHLYWLMDMDMKGLGDMAVGSVKPKMDGDEIKMEAVSPVFIVLVQELVKGVLELRYLKQLQAKSKEEISDEDIEKVYRYADRIEDEPRLIQIGPELWRRFLKAVNNSEIKKHMKPIEVYEHLMKMPPKELHKVVQVIVDNTEAASKKLEELFKPGESTVDIDKLLEEIQRGNDEASKL